jgi:hypothetical protein
LQKVFWGARCLLQGLLDSIDFNISFIILVSLCINFFIWIDRAERYCFLTTTLVIHSPFLLPSFIRREEKRGYWTLSIIKGEYRISGGRGWYHPNEPVKRKLLVVKNTKNEIFSKSFLKCKKRICQFICTTARDRKGINCFTIKTRTKTSIDLL